MPNIEIHGFSEKKAMELRSKIFNMFLGRPYIDEMVVTTFPTVVKDRRGNDQPYLRLANSHQRHTREILEKLGSLEIDIEHLKLEAFYPKGNVPIHQ